MAAIGGEEAYVDKVKSIKQEFRIQTKIALRRNKKKKGRRRRRRKGRSACVGTENVLEIPLFFAVGWARSWGWDAYRCPGIGSTRYDANLYKSSIPSRVGVVCACLGNIYMLDY